MKILDIEDFNNIREVASCDLSVYGFTIKENDILIASGGKNLIVLGTNIDFSKEVEIGKVGNEELIVILTVCSTIAIISIHRKKK